MSQYNIIAESQEYTVVSEYDHVATPAENYQSEADLEKEFIRLLQEQGMIIYLSIRRQTLSPTSEPSLRNSTTIISQIVSGSAFSMSA